MFRHLVFIMTFLYQSFIYNAELLKPLSPQEIVLVSYAQTQHKIELYFFKAEVNDLMTLDDIRTLVESKMKHYPIDVARPSTTHLVSTVIEQMLEKENKKSEMLHKKIVDSLKDFYVIGFVNKRIFNALNELLTQACKEKKTIIDSFFIKWSAIAQAYCHISGKYDCATRYFGSELLHNYGLFVKILREQDELVKFFIRALFVQNALLLPKQLILDKQQERTVQNIELFLKKEVNTAKVYTLNVLIPRDVCFEESLLRFLCEKNNIAIEDQNKEGHDWTIYLTPLEQK